MHRSEMIAHFFTGENVSPFETRFAKMPLEDMAIELVHEVHFIEQCNKELVIEHKAIVLELIVTTLVGDELKVLAPHGDVKKAGVVQHLTLEHLDAQSNPDPRVELALMIQNGLYSLATSQLSFIPTQTNPDLPFEPLPLDSSRIIGASRMQFIGAYENDNPGEQSLRLVAMMEVPRGVVEGHAKTYFKHTDNFCETVHFDQVNYEREQHNALTRLVEYFNSDQVEQPIVDVAVWWLGLHDF